MAACDGQAATDDALLCEAIGAPVTVVPSSAANLKVTRGEDIAIAEALLRERRALTPLLLSPVEPGEGERPCGEDDSAHTSPCQPLR